MKTSAWKKAEAEDYDHKTSRNSRDEIKFSVPAVFY